MLFRSLLLVLEFLDAADERDHDFGDYFYALLGYQDGGFEDGAGLHFDDLGGGDAETAPAVAQHWIELVEFFHAAEQRFFFGDLFLGFLRAFMTSMSTMRFSGLGRTDLAAAGGYYADLYQKQLLEEELEAI